MADIESLQVEVKTWIEANWDPNLNGPGFTIAVSSGRASAGVHRMRVPGSIGWR